MKEDKTFDSQFWKSILPFVIIVIFICFLPFIIIKYSWFGIDFSNSTDTANGINGFIAPFVAIIAAFLTFIAFWVQFKANKIQINIFDDQRKDIQTERFENKLFEMLNIHRENLNELKIFGYNDKFAAGRECVEYFYKELKRTYTFVINSLKLDDDALNVEEKINYTTVAYLIFFIGVNTSPDKNIFLAKMLAEYISAEKINNILNDFNFQKDEDRAIEENEDIITEKDKKLFVFYTHFEGHIHKLGHYFRHLYQLVKFIDEYPSSIISDEEKYKYIRLIRSQLSNYEQLLIYYNSFSKFGQSWNKNNYFIKYRIIKNVPLSITFGYKPQDKYRTEISEFEKNGNVFFEWEE